MSLFARLRAASLELRFQISSREALWPLMKPYSLTRTRRFRRGDEANPAEGRAHAGLAIVIDGFPGSANSFAMRAFRAMQDDPECLIGNHYHSAAETIRAAKLGVPVLVTLRKPIDAVNSMVRRWPFVPFESALRWYVMFYKAIEPHLDKVVVSDFKTVTSDFPGVVTALNERFGTSFKNQLPESRMAEFEPRLREADSEREKRLAEKKALEERFEAATSEGARKAADEMYDRMLSAAFRG